MNNLQKALIGIGVAVVGYQLYKHLSKPKGAETKSNASGLKEGMLKWHDGYGKVFKAVGTGFDARWVQLAPKDQPKAMEWYRLNDKWVWSKWNAKLDKTKVPNNYLLKSI